MKWRIEVVVENERALDYILNNIMQTVVAGDTKILRIEKTEEG